MGVLDVGGGWLTQHATWLQDARLGAQAKREARRNSFRKHAGPTCGHATGRGKRIWHVGLPPECRRAEDDSTATEASQPGGQQQQEKCTNATHAELTQREATKPSYFGGSNEGDSIQIFHQQHVHRGSPLFL